MATIHGMPTPNDWADSAPRQDHSRLGEWLKQARKARGLTLDDISRETKISLRNLEALERGHLGDMPAFYQRAEVRAMARAVGVDEELAIEQLETDTDTALAPAMESRQEDEENAARPWWKPSRAPAFVAVALGLTLAVGAGGAILSRMASGSGNPVTAAEPAPLVPSDTGTIVPAARPEPLLRPAPVAAAEPTAKPDTAAEAASPASFTEIIVTTDPPGAQVTVNGISWGVSPVTIRHLPPGAKRIRVTRQGFAAAEQELGLGAGQRKTLNLRLRAAE